MQWGDGCANANDAVTAGEAGSVTSTLLSAYCRSIGCMDANAINCDALLQMVRQLSMVTYRMCLWTACDGI